jgi:hypothetical protein
MKNHYILVYPDKPLDEKLDDHQFQLLVQNFYTNTKQIALQSEGELRLRGGTLLIARETAESVLPLVYRAAERAAIVVKIRFLSED